MYTAIIVEDDPMVAEINKQYLSAAVGVRLSGVFSNGDDAYAHVLESPPDLAIVDYYMPMLDGEGFINKCREAGIGMDFIMITAADSSDIIKRILRLGAVDYLVKPFTRECFVRAIGKFMNFRETTRDPARRLTQSEVDRMASQRSPEPASSETLLQKGLQQRTLERILMFMEENAGSYLGADEISQSVALSRITVRRYMNYLLENGEILSSIDYATGGRPSIRYCRPVR